MSGSLVQRLSHSCLVSNRYSTGNYDIISLLRVFFEFQNPQWPRTRASGYASVPYPFF